jgi:hypothetical protein
VLAIRVDQMERELIVASAPETYFVTKHYEPWPWMLIRLSEISPEDLRERLIDAWLLAAPKKLVDAHADSLAD